MQRAHRFSHATPLGIGGARLPAVCRFGRPSARPTLRVSATPELVDSLTQLAYHLPLAAGVGMPCSTMNCGDQIYRSTLDPVLRGEQTGPDWRTFLLLATVGAYLFLPPGPLPGLLDTTLLTNLYRMRSQVYTKEDITLGKQLATGGFGTVYKATLQLKDGSSIPVVVKKAKEFGEAEVWMNERMSRASPSSCAEFITALDDPAPSVSSPLGNAIWLVWKYEGDSTLASLMQQKQFPANMEKMLFGRELRLPKGAARNAATIRLAMKQLIECVRACHVTGIVHRDLKPQNCIVSGEDNKLKLIDMGAAADLRVGINYAPKEYLLDPRYAPPQQYIMSTQTAKPPPAAVAGFLSPVLWRMESPDRFDMYSLGVTLLQMAFVTLRNDDKLIAFRRRLEEKYKWDLRAWRRGEEKKGKEFAEGLELLDLDGAAGWDLLCRLMSFKPTDRPSASDALAHPFFLGGSDNKMAVALGKASRTIDDALAGPRRMLDDAILSGAKSDDLTEASLMETLGIEDAAPRVNRRVSKTIAWWQDRQAEVNSRLEREGRAPQPTQPSSSKPGKPAKGTRPPARKAAPAPAGGDDADVMSRIKLPSFFGAAKAKVAAEAEGGEDAAPAPSGPFSFLNLRKKKEAVVEEEEEEDEEEDKPPAPPSGPFSFLNRRK
ncbi:hypothetical protein FOA52_013877 [Chlamydomonas sp. UWO 241]|nr:hypothetical protein FOA52_013877 [Chlamydomonas sp. UWO 241]